MRPVDLVATFSALGLAGAILASVLNPGATLPAHCDAKNWRAPVDMVRAMNACQIIRDAKGNARNVAALKKETRDAINAGANAVFNSIFGE